MKGFLSKKKIYDAMLADRQRIEELYGLVSEKHEMIAEDRRKIEELYGLVSEKHEMIAEDRRKIEELYGLVSEKHEMIAEDRRKIEELYGLVSEKHEMIAEDRRKIEELYGLVSEKHEMIAEDRRKTEELYGLVSEKHELIAEDRRKIEELYGLVSEKHEMIAEDRGRINELYGLISEKHEMIMAAKQDITILSKDALLSYWGDREQTEEQREVIDWVRENGVAMYPYAWAVEYEGKETEVMTDDGWYYVDHNGKKLYFPKSYDAKEVKRYYNFLIMEQDRRSPHCYFTEEYCPEEEDYVWYDVGAAEGILMLDHIEEIKKGYLIECEAAWTEALERTFEPYRDKVTIIAKMADSYTDERHVALKDLIETEKRCLIKIDVEGYEQNVLEGIDWSGLTKDSMLIVCAYHRQEDEKELGRYLTQKGVEFALSGGYILSDWGGFREPYLRRGLFRGIKKD